MPKPTREQQRTQRNIRIVLIIISVLVVASMVLSLLPPPG
jgi:predicted nucleic acid-binding Zn ribbon protein